MVWRCVEVASAEAIKKKFRGILTRRATAIYQAGKPIEDVQVTFEVLIDCRKIRSELDAELQKRNEDDDDDLVGDVENAVEGFRVDSVAAQVGSQQPRLCVKEHTNTLEKEFRRALKDRLDSLP